MSKQYVGTGWAKVFANGGGVINISVKLDELNKLKQDKYGSVHLTVGARKEIDPKSKSTHWVAVDDYRHGKDGGEPF